MKILLFNHHPDCLHYMYKGLKSIGCDVEVASEKLTLQLFGCSSTKNYKFEFTNKILDPEDFSEEFKNVKWGETLGHDYYLAIKPNVLQIFGSNGWFDCQLQGELPAAKNYTSGIKSCNHPNANLFGYNFVPNWVPQKELVKEKKYITQLITLTFLSSEMKELEDLKNKGYEVQLGTLNNFIKDYEVLPYTSLLVHNKKTGINCYAVCKALDMGIPIYMEKYTKKLIGFGDLPDELFLFKDDMSIEEAYKKSLDMDNERIQETYRSIYTFERLQNALRKALNNDI